MNLFIIHSLLGDFSKTAEAIEKELEKEPSHTKTVKITPELIDNLSEDKSKALCKALLKECQSLREDNASMKDELNETYLKYDQISAAFGELNHLAQEASQVHTRHFKEQ